MPPRLRPSSNFAGWLLAASLAVLPIVANPGWKPGGEEDPVWRILALLTATIGLPEGLRRTSAYLTHPVFNTHHSETEMLRYIRSLSDKDLALDRSMIPLGSCTMKLNATTEMIPVIDLGPYLKGEPGALDRAATELRHALTEIGFYFIVNHGVPREQIASVFDQVKRFHAQPMEEKLKVKVNDHTIGYMPIMEKAAPNAAAQGKKPSQNEAFFLRRDRAADDPDVIAGRRFHVQNQWPANLPGFREQTLTYMEAMEAMCLKLVPLYALALGLPANHFDSYFAKPHFILRQSRYPQIDGSDDTIASLVPHTDSGFMTLLPPNKVQGLSILLPSGEWMDAPHVEGAFVVNGGDILHRWTNERFLSTPHRVRNVSGTVRYAIPFFFDPSHDSTIECLPTCQSAERPAAIEPLTAAATAAGNFMPAPKLFTPPTGGASSIAPVVAANTPYFSDAHYINKVGGQSAYLGDNIYATKGLARNLHLTVGLDGDISGFAWKTFYSHQESRVTVVDPQNTNNAKWMAAQDAVIAPAGTKVNNVDVSGTVQCWVSTQTEFAALYPGCVPANPASSTSPILPTITARTWLARRRISSSR